MDTLKSSEFRKRFARLTQPTQVTVNGHVIGEWRPFAADIIYGKKMEPSGEWAPAIVHGTDAKAGPLPGDRFNTQPFRGPIPKSGKPR